MVPVKLVPSFQGTLGGMIDSVLSVASHTRRKTGMTPNVFPSLGSVEYTGSGMGRVLRPPTQSERVLATWPLAGSESRQALSRTRGTRIIRVGPRTSSRGCTSRAADRNFVLRLPGPGRNDDTRPGDPSNRASSARPRVAPPVPDDEAARPPAGDRARVHRSRGDARRVAVRPRPRRSPGTARPLQREDAAVPAAVLPVRRDRRDLRLDALLLLASDRGPRAHRGALAARALPVRDRRPDSERLVPRAPLARARSGLRVRLPRLRRRVPGGRFLPLLPGAPRRAEEARARLPGRERARLRHLLHLSRGPALVRDAVRGCPGA